MASSPLHKETIMFMVKKNGSRKNKDLCLWNRSLLVNRFPYYIIVLFNRNLYFRQPIAFSIPIPNTVNV